MLARAADACATGALAALVTAPVQKSVLMDAGIAVLRTHRVFRAAHAHAARGDAAGRRRGGAPLRVALVTTHLALKDVPPPSRATRSAATLAIVARRAARRNSASPAPRIAVCGLNPHAGEGGHLGREEIDTIAPAIAAARARGIDATGPLPADTVFVPRHARAFDAIVAMYHDQGLPDAQGGELRRRRQRHARAAVHPHVGRSRHRARSRRRSAAGAPPPIRAACTPRSISR